MEHIVPPKDDERSSLLESPGSMETGPLDLQTQPRQHGQGFINHSRVRHVMTGRRHVFTRIHAVKSLYISNAKQHSYGCNEASRIMLLRHPPNHESPGQLNADAIHRPESNVSIEFAHLQELGRKLSTNQVASRMNVHWVHALLNGCLPKVSEE